MAPTEAAESSGGMTIEDNKPTPRRGRATPTLFTSNSNPTMPGNNTKKSQGEQRRRSIQYSPSSSPLSPFAVKNRCLIKPRKHRFGWIWLDQPGFPWIRPLDHRHRCRFLLSCFPHSKRLAALDEPGSTWISLDHPGPSMPRAPAPLLHALRSADSPFPASRFSPICLDYLGSTWIYPDLPRSSSAPAPTARPHIDPAKTSRLHPLLSVFSEKSAVQTGLIWLDQPGFTLIRPDHRGLQPRPPPALTTSSRLPLSGLRFPVSALPFAPFAPFCGHPPARSALLARNALVTLIPK